MDDWLTEEQERAGDRVVIGIILLFTSPVWLGALVALVRWIAGW